MSRQHHHHLDDIAADDPRLKDSPSILMRGTRTDRSHAQRRAQQRAISTAMIRIALAYGHLDHHHGIKRWTLLSKQLRRSPYARYERELRGLQLIGQQATADSPVELRTCKWNYALRKG